MSSIRKKERKISKRIRRLEQEYKRGIKLPGNECEGPANFGLTETLETRPEAQKRAGKRIKEKLITKTVGETRKGKKIHTPLTTSLVAEARKGKRRTETLSTSVQATTP